MSGLAIPDGMRYANFAMKLKDLASKLGVIKEFQAFVLKGNVMDLAVGVIIGAAFKTIVDAMVGDVITPVIRFVSRQPLAPGHTYEQEIWAGIGGFGGAVLNFLMVAAIVFFIFVKPMNKLKDMMARREEQKPAEPPPMPDDVKLLTEIRDLLKDSSQIAARSS